MRPWIWTGKYSLIKTQIRSKRNQGIVGTKPQRNEREWHLGENGKQFRVTIRWATWLGMVVIMVKGLLVWCLYQKHKKAAPLGRKAAPSWVEAGYSIRVGPTFHSVPVLPTPVPCPNHRAVYSSLRARVWGNLKASEGDGALSYKGYRMRRRGTCNNQPALW